MSAALSPAMISARSRHPSSRWPYPVGALQGRVAQLLELRGLAHADVAASVLEARGRSGLAVEPFARRLGIDPETQRRAEAGEIDERELPPALRQLL